MFDWQWRFNSLCMWFVVLIGNTNDDFFVFVSFILSSLSVSICECLFLTDILTNCLSCSVFQSSWQMRRFRERKKWYWRGRRRRQPGRRWGRGWMMSRLASSPAWWKLTTRPTMPPILTSLASGLVHYKVSSFYQIHTLIIIGTQSLCCLLRIWVEQVLMFRWGGGVVGMVSSNSASFSSKNLMGFCVLNNWCLTKKRNNRMRITSALVYHNTILSFSLYPWL